MFVSPQRNYIRKIPNFVKTNPITITKDFYKELIPDWLVMKGFPLKRNRMLFYYHDQKEGFVWFPIGIKEGLENYSIYYSIVNTFDYLHNIYLLSEHVPIHILHKLL